MLSFLALASSAFWGTSDFLAGVTSRRLPAAAVVAWSQGIALVILSALITVRGEWDWGPWLPYAVLAGLVGPSALVMFYAALSSGTMGVVAPIASLGVLVPVLVGWFRGDRPGTAAWVGIVVAVCGVVLASGPELRGGASPRPVVLALVAGVGFGLALVFLDLGARTSALHTLWGMRATSTAAFVLAALVLRRTGGVVATDLPLLTVIGVSDAAANGMFAVASSGGLLSLASVLSSLYPVVTVLLARFVLHERLRRIQVAGVVLCIAGAAAIAA